MILTEVIIVTAVVTGPYDHEYSIDGFNYQTTRHFLILIDAYVERRDKMVERLGKTSVIRLLPKPRLTMMALMTLKIEV
jgi:hypothetical protein